MHILLVDHEEKILTTLGDFFVARGHRVGMARNAREALSRMADAPPDVAICEIRTIGMDGIAFLRTVRRRFPGVSVLVLTGDRDLDTAIEAFRSGACDYLKKPVHPREILVRIEGIEGRCRRKNAR